MLTTMNFGTEAIVLKTIKFGDTSIICHLFTRMRGKQSCLIKGVRSTQKSKMKAQVFQPGNILYLELFQQTYQQFSSLKNFEVKYHYSALREDIVKGCIQMFILEVIAMVVVDDFAQEEVFDFLKDILIEIDTYKGSLALLPSYFLIQLNKLLGYTILNNWSANRPFVNIWEGQFVATMPQQPPFIEQAASFILSQLNAANSLHDLQNIHHDGQQHMVLNGLLEFMQYHYPQFKPLHTIPVLRTIL